MLKRCTMKKIVLIFSTVFFYNSFGQVFINEVDGDTPGTDTNEIVEIKSTIPNYSLTGLVLVLFNGGTSGTSNLSYQAFDLDGFSTDINGIFLLGRSAVVPAPSIIFSTTFIAAGGLQNGPDAVALYTGNASDFPTNTAATSTNLVSGFAYASSGSVLPTLLMNVFGQTVCLFESQPTGSASKSFQRKNDGTWEVKTPTPAVPNDGSGISLNYITTTTNLSNNSATTLPTVTEGHSVIFTFTTTNPVSTTPLIINFTLANTNFTTADYLGSLSATIPVGQSSVNHTIQILNDGLNDGDEEAIFSMGAVASGYNINNNNIVIRVNNINFISLPFGTPTNPTFGQVSNTAPLNYYSSIEGLAGNALKQALQAIIANPNVVHGQNYGDVYEIIRVADQNPANSNQVWLIYTEEGRSKIDEQSGSITLGKYNREHIYCQSRGGFSDGTSSMADGIDIWEPAGPNIITTGHADAHHIRPVDSNENSSRNDRNYGVDYNGPAGTTSNAWKGDASRALFYMGVRYNGLNVVNGNPANAPVGQIGDLATLLNWNALDPADDYEMNRNNYIYTWQMNRNPFIDYPLLASYIYGANFGQPWHATLSNSAFAELKVNVFPNPTTDFIKTSGITDTTTIEIYGITGSKVFQTVINQDTKINLQLAKGFYMIKLSTIDKMILKKLVIE